ncbi:MAG: hypothetical protein COA79_04445 [Planctomycetota bacterium]|nr:MAG: hypothetical protein COA79_04445 [Planctomycetota bacterium]
MLFSKFKVLFSIFTLCLLSSFVMADENEHDEESDVSKDIEISIGDIKLINVKELNEKFKIISRKTIIKNRDGEVVDLSDEMSKRINDAIKIKLHDEDGVMKKDIKITIGNINLKDLKGDHENMKAFSRTIILRNGDGKVVDLSDEMSEKITDAFKNKLNGEDVGTSFRNKSYRIFKSSNKLTTEKFNQLDTDENENLDQDEFLIYVNNYFSKLDKDGDKFISKDEFPVSKYKSSVVFIKSGEPTGSNFVSTVSKFVSTGDKKELYIHASTSNPNESNFDLLDQDKDELITYDEFSAGAIKKFKSLDKDGNGYISMEESK